VHDAYHSTSTPFFSVEIVSHFGQTTVFPIFLKIMLMSSVRPGLQKEDHGRLLEKVHRVKLSSTTYSPFDTFFLPGNVRKWDLRISSNTFMMLATCYQHSRAINKAYLP
jgi:hypothetical protein